MEWKPISGAPKDCRVDLKDEWGDVTKNNKWHEKEYWVRGKRDQILMSPHHQTHWKHSTPPASEKE